MSLRALTVLGSPFLPVSIAGNVLWLDPTDNSTITLTSGKTSQWNDKSGSGNNVVQNTNAAYRWTPTAAAINGQQAMSLPGVAAFPASTGMTCTLAGGNLTTFSFGCIAQGNSWPTFGAFICSETASGDITCETNGGDATKLDAYMNGVGASGATVTATFPNATACWIFYTYSTPTLTVYKNNVQVLSTTTNLTSRKLAALIGIGGDAGGAGFAAGKGFMGTVVLYNLVLSSTDRGNLYSKYINPVWGV